jgi:hypothetical protein
VPDVTETLTRRRRFAQVPELLVLDQRVGDRAFRLWCRLDRYAGQDGAAFPSRDRLASDLGCSKASIQRALSQLTDTGWISRRQTSSTRWDTTLHDEPSAVIHRRVTGDSAQGWRVTTDSPAESPVTRIRRAIEGEEVSPCSRGTSPRPEASSGGAENDDPNTAHLHEPNARRALTALRRDRELVVPVAELLAVAYRVGAGDPWTGYLAIKRVTDGGLDTARNRAAVVRARLAELGGESA